MCTIINCIQLFIVLLHYGIQRKRWFYGQIQNKTKDN